MRRARFASGLERCLESFVKTSGGKCLHVVAPVKPAAGWNAEKTLTKCIAVP